MGYFEVYGRSKGSVEGTMSSPLSWKTCNWIWVLGNSFAGMPDCATATGCFSECLMVLSSSFLELRMCTHVVELAMLVYTMICHQTTLPCISCKLKLSHARVAS